MEWSRVRERMHDQRTAPAPLSPHPHRSRLLTFGQETNGPPVASPAADRLKCADAWSYPPPRPCACRKSNPNIFVVAIRRELGGKECALPSSRCAIGARPYPRPSACASHYSSERKISECGADAPRPGQWCGPSRRIDPINRSAKPFCQGEAGAIGLSRMPMARNRRVTTVP